MDDIKDILPEIVILLNVLVKTTLTSFAIVIENKFLNAANIAHCGHVYLVSWNRISKTSKRINDNTKDNIKTCNVDNNLESSIMDKLDQIIFIVVFVVNNHRDISDSTTHSHSFV